MCIRDSHTIKAETYEEAVKLMKQSFQKDICDSGNTYYGQERMYYTDEYMEVKDNRGQATAELYADTELGEQFIIDNLNNTEN